MLKLRKFEPPDIEQLAPSAIDADRLSLEWAERNAASGPAYTAFAGKQMIGAAGVRLLDSHTGVLWAVFSKEMRKCVKTTLRSSRELIAVLIDEFDLKVLYAESRKGLATSQRLLEHLGFVKMDKETKTHYCYRLEV